MTTLHATPAALAPFLPAGAYDLTIKDFVARWKTPNTYAQKGYISDSRFLAAAFLAAVQAEMPALNGWAIQTYDREPANLWTDRASLTDGAAWVWASTRGYGADAYTRVKLQGYAVAAQGKHSSKSIEISAALSRPVAAIAKDIARRVLPELDAAKAEANAKAKAEREQAEKITRKAEQLAKRYSNLRVSPDTQSGRVRIESKYGAGIHLDAYTYQSTTAGGYVWPLTSYNGRAIGADDIDSKGGRALLKACNDH